MGRWEGKSLIWQKIMELLEMGEDVETIAAKMQVASWLVKMVKEVKDRIPRG